MQHLHTFYILKNHKKCFNRISKRTSFKYLCPGFWHLENYKGFTNEISIPFDSAKNQQNTNFFLRKQLWVNLVDRIFFTQIKCNFSTNSMLIPAKLQNLQFAGLKSHLYPKQKSRTTQYGYFTLRSRQNYPELFQIFVSGIEQNKIESSRTKVAQNLLAIKSETEKRIIKIETT